MTDTRQKQGGLNGLIHVEMLRSIFGITLAGFMAGYGSATPGIQATAVGVGFAVLIGLVSFWWMPGAKRIAAELEAETQ